MIDFQTLLRIRKPVEELFQSRDDRATPQTCIRKWGEGGQMDVEKSLQRIPMCVSLRSHGSTQYYVLRVPLSVLA